MSFIQKVDLSRATALSVIFVLLFLIQLPFISFGLDTPDLGYILTNQELASRLGLQYVKVMPFWWLTDLIAGEWFKLTESYGLWGARLGGIIAFASAITIFASTLFQIYKPSIGLVCVLLLAGLCERGSNILDYSKMPLLFYSVFGFYFLKLHLEPSRTIFQITGGIVLALLVFSRMPMILALGLPGICFLISYWFDKERYRLYGQAYLKMLAVTCFCFFLMILIFQSQDLLKGYFFYQTPTKHHQIGVLFGLVMNQLYEKIPFVTCLIIVFFTASFLLKRKVMSKKVAAFVSFSTLIFCLAVLMIYLIYPQIKQTLKFFWLDNLSLYLTFFSTCAFFIYLIQKKILFCEIALVVLAVSYPILASAGSAAGLQGAYPGALLFGFSYLLIFRVADLYDCKIPLSIVFASLLLIIGYRGTKQIAFTNSSPLKHTYCLELPRLNGIYTTPERGENLQSLVQEISGYTKKGDRILAFPFIPMVYYASGTLPLGDHADLGLLDFESLANKLDKILEMPPPKVIIKSKIDKELSFDWRAQLEFIDELREKIDLFDRKISSKWQPKLIWSNDYFELFIPSEDAFERLL